MRAQESTPYEQIRVDTVNAAWKSIQNWRKANLYGPQVPPGFIISIDQRDALRYFNKGYTDPYDGGRLFGVPTFAMYDHTDLLVPAPGVIDLR